MQRMRYTRITFKWFLSKKISLDFLLYSHVPSCVNTILRGTRTKRARRTLRTNEVVLDYFLPWMEVWWTCLKYLRFLRYVDMIFGSQTSELSSKKNWILRASPPHWYFFFILITCLLDILKDWTTVQQIFAPKFEIQRSRLDVFKKNNFAVKTVWYLFVSKSVLRPKKYQDKQYSYVALEQVY